MSGKIEKSSTEDSKHEGDAVFIVYHNESVFSAGADGKIKIWDKDLNLKKVLNTHEAYIYSLAITSNGKLYSSSCDGTIKYLQDPHNSDNAKELLKCEDEIECLICSGEKLYSGDDKGVVTMWENDKILFKFNLVEQVKSLAIENNIIYTAREMDAVITEIMPGKSGKYYTKAVIPGRAPIILIGPVEDGRKSLICFATRNGKGINLAKNGDPFQIIWTKEDCHDMIINCFCGDEKTLYSAGWDGKVKKWSGIEKSPEVSAEVVIGSCINSICNGPDDGSIYTASSDGIVRRVRFT